MASAQASKIIKKMKVRDTERYLIKYKGLCDDYNQWVQESDLEDFNALKEAFDSRHSFPEENSSVKCRELYIHWIDEGFIVEKIVDKRSKGGRLQYKCKYKDYPDSRNNWEYFSDLYNCLNVVKKYEDQKLSAGETPSTVFEEGWEAVTVLGPVDRDTSVDCDKDYYLVGLKNQQTKEFKKVVLNPEHQEKVEELVRIYQQQEY